MNIIANSVTRIVYCIENEQEAKMAFYHEQYNKWREEFEEEWDKKMGRESDPD